MTTTIRARRHAAQGRALRPALAALLLAACAAPRLEPRVPREALTRLANAVTRDVYGRPVNLRPALAGRVLIYFFRSTCAHCAPEVAAAQRLARVPGAPKLILISRESAATLRAVFRPRPGKGLLVVADTDGAIMGGIIPTRFVPRMLVVARGRVLLDRTGARRAGELARAASSVGGMRR